jgi:hypothetical protein
MIIGYELRDWIGSIIGLVVKLFVDNVPGILTEEFP